MYRDEEDKKWLEELSKMSKEEAIKSLKIDRNTKDRKWKKRRRPK